MDELVEKSETNVKHEELLKLLVDVFQLELGPQAFRYLTLARTLSSTFLAWCEKNYELSPSFREWLIKLCSL